MSGFLVEDFDPGAFGRPGTAAYTITPRSASRQSSSSGSP